MDFPRVTQRARDGARLYPALPGLSYRNPWRRTVFPDGKHLCVCFYHLCLGHEHRGLNLVTSSGQRVGDVQVPENGMGGGQGRRGRDRGATSGSPGPQLCIAGVGGVVSPVPSFPLHLCHLVGGRG